MNEELTYHYEYNLKELIIRNKLKIVELEPCKCESVKCTGWIGL